MRVMTMNASTPPDIEAKPLRHACRSGAAVPPVREPTASSCAVFSCSSFSSAVIVFAIGLLVLGAFPPEPHPQPIEKVLPNDASSARRPHPAPPADTAAPARMDRHLEAFLEMLAAERGAARNTLAPMTADLTDLAAFAARTRAGAVAARRRDAAQPISVGCPRRPRGPDGRAAAVGDPPVPSVPRARGRPRRRPDGTLDAPRLPRSLPKYLSEAEVDALLAAAGRLSPAQARLAHAALEILYATGLRVSEMLALPRRCAGRRRGAAAGPREGRRASAIVPLSDAARAAAAAMVAARKKPARWLFPGRDPRQAMTRQGFAPSAEAGRAGGRDRPGAGQPARPAPFLRQPHACARRRPAQPATSARPR